MNDSLNKDLSLYQLALGVEAPPQPLPLNPATLLSMVRAQIDLLIEQQIRVTLWVKLPLGKIWQAELVRYQSSVGVSSTIYNCQMGIKREKEKAGEEIIPASLHYLDVQLLPYSQLRREYFLMVLSPQFCSLILVYRSRKRGKLNTKKNLPLLAVTTIDSKVIQPVLDGIKQANAPESSPILSTDFICPSAFEPALMSQLLAKQLQRQDEINRQIRTERIAKLQQQNQKLHKKERLKDEYLSSVCQELRTPLTQMKTALSLLNSPTLKPLQRQRYLQMLNTQCDRQSTLITSLLDLVELEQNLEGTSLELVSLADIVPGVVSTYQPLAQEKGIMLAYTVPNELPAIWCVSGGLRQIVINLLHNSIKFTPNGGQVWVKARVQGKYVQLEFRDTGIGIAENEIPRIFDCFYRVRSGVTEDFGGAGLGLTIVQRLLWRCGGSIAVRSKLDEGSIFTMQLAIQNSK
jgi:signal transduction histidine kinase